MDDALSAVDTETEEAILHNFSDELAGKTASSSPTASPRCGTATRSSTWSTGASSSGATMSLLAAGGRYAQLYAQQSQEDERGGGRVV